jgi:hypothetical protein
MTVLLVGAVHGVCLRQPLVDCMPDKQIYVANKARAIAGSPVDLFRNTFDWLDETGRRSALTEEVPLFPGLVAALYRIGGERELFGRLCSMLATLIAIFALYDLVRGEWDAELALSAAIVFGFSPLLLAYGHAFQADACMLACMLLSAASYRRFLDGRGMIWLASAAVAALLAALFKYYGLMVLIPLADMAWRRRAWRCLAGIDMWMLAAAVWIPLLAWLEIAYRHAPTPSAHGLYFAFQDPDILLRWPLYARFFDRFLWKDCGGFNCFLLASGIVAAAAQSLFVILQHLFDSRPWERGTQARRLQPAVLCLAVQAGKGVSNPVRSCGTTSWRPILGWTIMGTAFFFLMGPKLLGHDYYELMLVPVASICSALGWRALLTYLTPSPIAKTMRWAPVIILLGVSALNSPLALRASPELERGFVKAALHLNALSEPGKRFVAAGEGGVIIVHYSHHEGWAIPRLTEPDQLVKRLPKYQSMGADYLMIYINAAMSSANRQSFRELAESLPLLEHQEGNWSALGDHHGEFFIIDLRRANLAAAKWNPSPCFQ